MKKKYFTETESTRDAWLDLAGEYFYEIEEVYLDPEVSELGPFQGDLPCEMFAYKRTDDELKLVGEYKDGREVGSRFDWKTNKLVWGKFGDGHAWICIPEEPYKEILRTLSLKEFHAIAKKFNVTIPGKLNHRSMLIKLFEKEIGEENLREILMIKE